MIAERKSPLEMPGYVPFADDTNVDLSHNPAKILKRAFPDNRVVPTRGDRLRKIILSAPLRKKFPPAKIKWIMLIAISLALK